MRILGSILLLFPLCASAQTLSGQSPGSNVTVIEKKWRMEVRNLALEKDPVREMNDRAKVERQRRETERTERILNERGKPTGPTAVPTPATDAGRRGFLVIYSYEVKFSNTGEKGIRKLTYDYVFFEPGTETEVGRLQFVRTVNISPRGSKSVVVHTKSAPTETVDATKAGKKPGEQYTEQIVIQSVEYADGSVWRAASNKM